MSVEIRIARIDTAITSNNPCVIHKVVPYDSLVFFIFNFVSPRFIQGIS